MRNQPGAWRALPILMVLSALSLLDRQVLSLLVGPLKRDLAVSDFQVGLLQGLAFAIFYSIAGLPLGWLADRFARRPLIWAGVTAWGAAAAACGLAQSLPALVAARMGVGVGEAALSPAANSMLADLFRPSRLAVALSVLSIGSNLGNGAAFALGGLVVAYAEHGGSLSLPLVGTLHSWQFVFLVTGLPGIFLAPLIFAIPEPVRRARSATSRSPAVRATLAFMSEHRGFFGAHFLGFGIYSVAAWAYLSWLPTYMARAYGWSIQQISIPLALIVAIGAPVGTVASGAVVDHFFGRGRTDAHMRVFALIALGMAVFGVFAFQSPEPGLFLILATPIAAFMSLGPTATAALQIACPNEMRGQVNAVFLLVMNGMGIALGPPLVGAITDFVFHDERRIGDAVSLVFLILMPLSAAILLWGARHMRRCVARADVWIA